MAEALRRTYAIEGSGPFDEEAVRERVRAYCDEHGFIATLSLTVTEMIEGEETGRRIDPGQFLDR